MTLNINCLMKIPLPHIKPLTQSLAIINQLTCHYINIFNTN